MSATLEKALLLIEAMAKAGKPSGVTQLSRDLNLNKSTVYRLLDILCKQGYTRQEPMYRQYALTTKMWELGVSVLNSMSVHAVAPPFMAAAVEQTDETLLLTIPDGDNSLVVDKADSSQPLRIFSAIGTRLPLHCSSVGKALMIDWTDEQIRRFAPHKRARRTDRTIHTSDELVDQVRKARATGYGLSCDEWLVGVSGVAAPIRDATGMIVASVGITFPTSRAEPGTFEAMGEKVVEVAASISQVLGYVEEPETTSELAAARL